MSEEVSRDVLDVDVLFVGGGPSSLLGAIHLANLLKAYEQQRDVTKDKKQTALDEVTILVIEKGANPGAHSISGAVMDPVALRSVFPNFEKEGFPIQAEVNPENEAVYLLTDKWALKSPVVPPTFHNEGNYIVSLGDVVKWLAEKAEATEMIEYYPGFPAASPIIEDGKVVGVRCQDMGIDKDGKPKPNFEAGMDIRAKVTIFGEGSRGSCTKQVIDALDLEGPYPPQFSLGVKEVWEVPEENRANSLLKKGGVIHTAGYPLATDNFGGSWVYGMDNNMISLGLVVALDYADPHMDPHELFQKFKTHPLIQEILKDGKMISYGAKTIPEGGYYARPKSYGDGFMLIGDSAGLINMTRLKGIHLAMQSGVFAAEAAMTALKTEDSSEFVLSEYEWLIENSWVKKELWKSRYFRQGFSKGFVSGTINTGIQQALNGWTPFAAKPKKEPKQMTNFLVTTAGIVSGLIFTPILLWLLSLSTLFESLFSQLPMQLGASLIGAGLIAGFLHVEIKAKPIINATLTLLGVSILFLPPLLSAPGLYQMGAGLIGVVLILATLFFERNSKPFGQLILTILAVGAVFLPLLILPPLMICVFGFTGAVYNVFNQSWPWFGTWLNSPEKVQCLLSVLFCWMGIGIFHHLRNECPMSWSYSKNNQEKYGLIGLFFDVVFGFLDGFGNFVTTILFEDPAPEKLDHEHYKTLKEYYGGHPPKKVVPKYDNKYLFDKVSDVYHSGAIHEENQPPHLRVQDLDLCKDRCTEEYGNPCQYFCPTAVYEMVEDSEDKSNRKKLFLNFSNCVHCKTCDIKDPYGQIVWWVPEGGGGPNYNKL